MQGEEAEGRRVREGGQGKWQQKGQKQSKQQAEGLEEEEE